MSNEKKSGLELQQVLDELRKPFHPSQITWKPGAVKGERALALAYADLRAYMNRLDDVCGSDWSVAYEPWGEDRIICRLTILGVTRSSTGETTNESERSEIGGTVAEAQAFKRASAMFGLGRYLYNLPTGWADYDPKTKWFTDKAKAKLTGILVQHYRRATDLKTEQADLFAAEADLDEAQPVQEAHQGNGHSNGNGNSKGNSKANGKSNGNGATVAPELAALFEQFNTLGQDLYGDQWEKVCQRNVSRISGGKAQNSGELTPEQIQQLITGMTKLKSKREPVAVLS
ncbi:MAG: hypothetical protein IT328_06105 [Caldilineaceae bacterium]|nr:hypothetical protein [Caldilineaceae bacterium]